MEKRCVEAREHIESSEGIHALIPLGQALKATQAELQTVAGFTPKTPSAAPAGAAKVDVLKHALRHNVDELERYVEQARDAAGDVETLATLNSLEKKFNW